MPGPARKMNPWLMMLAAQNPPPGDGGPLGPVQDGPEMLGGMPVQPVGNGFERTAPPMMQDGLPVVPANLDPPKDFTQVPPPPPAAGPRAVSPGNPLQAAGSPTSPLEGGAKQRVQPPDPAMLSQLKAGIVNQLPELGDGAFARTDKDSGRRTVGQADVKANQASKTTEATNPAAMAEALSRLISMPTPGIQMQREHIAKLEALAGGPDANGMTGDRAHDERQAKRNGPIRGLNLLPIMGLLDKEFGTNLATTYSPPASQDKLKAALQKQIGEGIKGLTDDEQAYLKSQLGDQSQLGLIASMMGQRTATEGTAGKAANPFEAARLEDQRARTADDQRRKDYEEVQKLTKEMGTGPSRILEALKGVQGILKGRPDGKLPGTYSTQDIPGIGGMLPNFSVRPPAALTGDDEAKALAQYNETILSEIGRMASGLNMTQSEVERKKTELGIALTQGRAEYMRALNGLKADMIRAHKALRDKMSPGAKAEFDKMNDVTKAEDFEAVDFGTPSKSGVKVQATAEDLIKQAKERAKALSGSK